MQKELWKHFWKLSVSSDSTVVEDGCFCGPFFTLVMEFWFWHWKTKGLRQGEMNNGRWLKFEVTLNVSVAIGGHADRDRMVEPFQWMLGML